MAKKSEQLLTKEQLGGCFECPGKDWNGIYCGQSPDGGSTVRVPCRLAQPRKMVVPDRSLMSHQECPTWRRAHSLDAEAA
jgi:hypothetical protein